MCLIPYIFPFSPYAYENRDIEMLSLYPSIPSHILGAQISLFRETTDKRQQGKTNKR